ncbi:MAG: asparagine synthase (glutamine-hydrolyzing) [Desulfobacterales bacterium]|nr:asparagine synthase (glutamine-hydrolyzing) [Desulfobacterales bacterium]
MCGIHGIVSRSISKNELLNQLSLMGDVQRHRGPDDKQEIVYDGAGNRKLGFGFVRLSIIDLDTGMQPIQCPSDKTAIMCNGQVYNYIELRFEVPDAPFITKGDIEVALHLYRSKGLNFLNYLNGMYAGAIYDPQKNKLLLFRDRFGIKPLYYLCDKDNFYFASEIKPLFTGSGIEKQLNEKHLGTFFTYRYVPGKETLFKGVMKLPPGSFLEYDLNTGNFRTERYWEYKLDKENPTISENEAVEQFNDLFTDAVKIRLRSDVEVGSLISSGIDSSAVASLTATIKPDVRLFTIAFAEEKYNELPQVQEFINNNKTRFTGTKHYTKLCSKETLDELPGIVRSIEEPISLGAVLPTDQVCRLAGDHLKVVLTGEGADEIFAGYRKFLIETAAFEYKQASVSQKKDLADLYPELLPYLAVRADNPTRRYIQSEALFTREELSGLLGSEQISTKFPGNATPSLSGIRHPLNMALAMESRSRLPDYVILRLDKLSMRHSLETRTPFLDYRLAEFAATLPVNLKTNIETGQEKYICRKAFLKYNILDDASVNRKKQPFTMPLADWLSDPESLPDFLQEIISGDTIKSHGILSSDFVKSISGSVTSDGVGPETLVSGADRLFSIIMFTLWYDEFFK